MNLEEAVKQAKEKGYKVFKITIAGAEYVYRVIPRSEWREHTAKQTEGRSKEEIEDELVRKFLVYPDPEEIKWDMLPAGVATKLMNNILYSSGFDEMESYPEEL